ncbi:hypothetical protein LguiA_025286 [Lonicera macranthoides]
MTINGFYYNSCFKSKKPLAGVEAMERIGIISNGFISVHIRWKVLRRIQVGDAFKNKQKTPVKKEEKEEEEENDENGDTIEESKGGGGGGGRGEIVGET